MEYERKFKLLRLTPRDVSNEWHWGSCLFGIVVSIVAGKCYLQITRQLRIYIYIYIYIIIMPIVEYNSVYANLSRTCAVF